MARKLVFWSHLAVGVSGAAVILIMAVTGVLLTYEHQLLDWSTRAYWEEPATGDSRLPLESLVDAVAAYDHEAAASRLTLRSDPAAPVAVRIDGGRTVYVNPYTGAVLGEGSQNMRTFMRTVMYWHRWLAMEGDNRAIGKAISGAFNLGFLFLVVSGLYLWIPRQWSWRNVRTLLTPRADLRGHARDFNWHNALGFWAAIPLAIVVATAVPISYRWAGDLTYRVFGEEPPVRGAANRAGGGQEESVEHIQPRQPAGLEQLLARAEQRVDGWQQIRIPLPVDADEPVTVTIDRGTGRQPQKQDRLVLDPVSAEVVAWQPFAERTPASRARSFMRFAHTGEYWGFWGQTIAGLASGFAVVLVWTGLALAWRRAARALGRRRAGTRVPVRVRRQRRSPGTT